MLGIEPKTLNHVLETLKLSDAKMIFTDRLKNYKYLMLIRKQV